MNDVIRIGKVSSVNAGAGTVRVTYPDKDDAVTAELPVFSFTDEYKMPGVGSQVLVVHLSNGSKVTIHASEIYLDGAVSTSADIDVSGVSAKNNTHTGVHGETGPAH